MAAQQYGDLPQIPHNMDESRYPVWAAEHYGYMHLYKQHNVSFGCEEDLCYENLDNGMVSIQPMDRFMHDQYPLSQAVLHAKFPTQRQFDIHYEPQWPSSECFRHHSPSSNSSDSSYTAPNELHSPHTYHEVSYGSPTDMFSQTSLPYHTIEDFKQGSCVQSPSLFGGNVSLRQLEYEHQEPELEPAMEDIDQINLKEESVCKHEHDPVRTDTTTSVDVKEYADSGIGNSVRDAESVQPIDLQDIQDLPEDPSSDSDYKPRSSRSNKRRRSSASSSISSKVSKRSASSASGPPKVSSSTKVSKRSRQASNATKTYTKTDDERRRFPCILSGHGCNATFPSKNEWKRHVSTQHIKLSFWRCDLCLPTTDPNDDQAFYYNEFNRKDLFAQHLRRMHAAPKDCSARSQKDFPVNEDNLQEHQARCLKPLRKAPQESICLFCDTTFEGPSSWDECVEHVGRHLEKDQKGNSDMLDIKTWNRDTALEEYLLEEGLIFEEQGAWKIGDGKPRRPALEDSDESEED
jgi:hypothetical protein